MSSVNSWSVSGRLGKDAEVRYTANQKAITSFSIAVDVGWGDKKRTMWVSCGIWGDRGEKVAPHLTKGLSITLIGELELREYVQEGVTKQRLNITVSDWDFLGKPESQGQQQGQGGFRSNDNPGKQKSQQRDFNAFEDDDIPF